MPDSVRPDNRSRRRFLKSAVMIVVSERLTGARRSLGQSKPQAPVSAPADTYETQAKGIRILPGQWRPHYPWEQIVWISPAWPSQDYVWLDFPEAIFSSQGLLYLSHINPGINSLFPELPKVHWREVSKGLSFERALPNGIRFGGSVVKSSDLTVALELHLANGSRDPLKNIELQTCAYLRGIKEFSDFTRENKFVHMPSEWVPMTSVPDLKERDAPYRVGWRTRGKRVADLPVAVVKSNKAERLLAMTWFGDTLSMVSNPNHPCIHADPRFPDLAPGEKASIRGKLVFFEGKLAEFDANRLVATQ